MDRLLSFWRKHFPVEEDALRYLQPHIRLRQFAAGDYFMFPGESRQYWCFVLSGATAGVQLLPDGRRCYPWVALPGRYFTGTAHPFTGRAAPLPVVFLKNTCVLMVPATHLRYAQQHFISVSELIHVLKEQRIQRQEVKLALLMLNTTERYACFRQWLPDVAAALKEEEQIRFLHMSRSCFFTAKAAYARAKKT